MRYFFIAAMLLLAGCGDSDHLYGSHSQDSTTFSNISSVITGSITTGTMKPPTAVAIGYQDGQIYLDNEFFFSGIAVDRWTELNAKLEDGKTLYSFYNGTPIRRASVTVSHNLDWHGETGTRLNVSGKNDGASVSINPFSNLAYWVKQANFIDYTTARNTVNEGLNLPPCPFERKLCPDHIVFLQLGNNIYATKDGFVRTFPGNVECSGTIKDFPACQ